jgi:hypothetical protein
VAVFLATREYVAANNVGRRAAGDDSGAIQEDSGHFAPAGGSEHGVFRGAVAAGVGQRPPALDDHDGDSEAR